MKKLSDRSCQAAWLPRRKLVERGRVCGGSPQCLRLQSPSKARLPDAGDLVWLRPEEIGTRRLRGGRHSNEHGHWAIVDLIGKGGHIRTVAVRLLFAWPKS